MDATTMGRLHEDVTKLKVDVAELMARTEALLDMLRSVANVAKSTAAALNLALDLRQLDVPPAPRRGPPRARDSRGRR